MLRANAAAAGPDAWGGRSPYVRGGHLERSPGSGLATDFGNTLDREQFWRWAQVKLDTPRRAVTLSEVRAHRDEIMQLGDRFGVRNIRVFGSVARGEATSDSDLDLLVDVDRGHGYVDMAGFALGVEDRLGVFTQVATTKGLKLRIRDRILREAVAL